MRLPINFYADFEIIEKNNDPITAEFKVTQFLWFMRKKYTGILFETQESVNFDHISYFIVFDDSQISYETVNNEILTFIPGEWMPLFPVPDHATVKQIDDVFVDYNMNIAISDGYLLMGKMPLAGEVADALYNACLQLYRSVI